MPKLATPLSDVQARTAKPKDKQYKLTDGGGLYLLVKPTGAVKQRPIFTTCQRPNFSTLSACSERFLLCLNR